VAERYPVGKRVQGTVTRLTDYGAFVKLENEINGLVHLSEITHAKIADASDVLKIGQKIDVQVINIEPDERRIGLSIKALLPIDKKMLEEMKKEEEASKSSKKKSETAKDSDDSKGSSGFVASKTGKKYYPADSAAGKRIKEENRVEFASEKEAEKAGYAA